MFSPGMEQHVVHSDVDRYVIVEYLAEGGMGAIFLGKKIGMGGFEKEVVLKQLLPEYTSQPEFIDLFLREAKLSAALDHANIVHTIDLVKAGSDYFIVMEYVRGGDLRAILHRVKHRGRQLSPGAAIFIAREVLSALAYAHDKKNTDGVPLKLIHRDVSPSNIMVSASGEVKLTDFGIAKASTHKSVFYRVKGKVGYMSPEQAYGDRPLDLRSDLYSLAVCLYEMLTGERLFVADLLSTPDQIYRQPIPKLEGERPGMPRGLDQVMGRALAFNADKRFQTALELQEALVQVAFESAMLFSAPDLAAHLRETCGEDPSTWNHESADQHEEVAAPPGTEVLAEEAGAQFSGVELTSVFTGLPAALGPRPHVDDGDETRQLVLPPNDLAFRATDFAGGQPAASGREKRTATPAFDVSDLDEHEPVRSNGSGAGPHRESGPHRPGSPRAEHSPLPRRAPRAPTTSDSGLWSDGDDEADAPTVAIQEAVPSYLARRALEAGPVTGPERVGAPGSGRPADRDERVAESREGESRRRVKESGARERWSPGDPTERVPEELGRTRELEDSGARASAAPAPAPPRGTARLFDSLRRRPAGSDSDRVDRARRWQRTQRLVVVIISLVLLGAGGAIVALVGLTGPSLDDPTRPRRDPLPGSIPASVDASPAFPRPGLARRDAAPAAPLDRGLVQAASRPSPDEPGFLRVTSTPPRATVRVDNVVQCETPCTVEDLRRGQVYVLSVRRKNYVSWSALVDLGPRRSLAVNAFLTEEPDPRRVGHLMIQSSPNAEVLVDGKPIGRVTSEGRIPLPPGQYEISLTHPQRIARPRYPVTITAGQTALLTAKKF